MGAYFAMTGPVALMMFLDQLLPGLIWLAGAAVIVALAEEV